MGLIQKKDEKDEIDGIQIIERGEGPDGDEDEKIDRVVTNRILGLPIFVVIMFCVYYIAVSTLGGTVTDFTNDQLFGTDGWYVLGQGRDAYDAAVEAAGDAADSVDPAQYGPYVPGITTVVHDALVEIGRAHV